MTYISLGQMKTFGCGDVEMLILFCDFVSREPIKPYHAEFLLEKLLQRVQLWPVDLELKDIAWMVRGAYKSALRKHFKMNPSGPLPNQIRYYPQYNTIRYWSRSRTIITLDLASEILFVQGYSAHSLVMYNDNCVVKMSPPVCVNADHILTPDEIRNLPILLGDVCNLLQSR